MKRIYENVALEHFAQYKQMLFFMGPRQVGKTTTSQAVGKEWGNYYYFSWDVIRDRRILMSGEDVIAAGVGLAPEFPKEQKKPLIIFDEIHKAPKWKLFLKGFYDGYVRRGSIEDFAKVLVTGSAKMNVYKRGGDSLMGRYFYFRFHPLTIAEILNTSIPESEIRTNSKKISNDEFEALWKFGGYPDPFNQASETFYNKWKKLRLEKLFNDDVRNLTRVQELDQFEKMAQLITSQIGQNASYDSLSNKLGVAGGTIRNWFSILKNLYYCFEVRPWSRNITRSLVKEPKYFLWDWAMCKDIGERAENFVASHLLKAVHFWNDYGFGDYELHYLRDKDQREVDFAIIKNGEPWILIEVKNSEKTLSPSLIYFQKMTKAPYAFQLVFNMPYENRDCFEESNKNRPVVVPISTFLSQLI